MEPFSKEKYSSKVAQLLMQRIRNGKLRPGDSIGEAQLAEECGISRAPVREALHHLEAEGLLMSHPRRGKCVTILTPEIIRNNYELSALLEGEAAARAVHGLPKEVHKRLETIIGQMQAAIQAGGAYEEHADLGTQFHKTILSLSENPLLRSLASRFSRVISKYLLYQEWRTIYTPEELLDRHNRLFLALQTRDEATIRAAFREHYAESAERLAQFCQPATSGKSGKKKAHFPTE